LGTRGVRLSGMCEDLVHVYPVVYGGPLTVQAHLGNRAECDPNGEPIIETLQKKHPVEDRPPALPGRYHLLGYESLRDSVCGAASPVSSGIGAGF
jgi:hypothetical protein